MTKFLIVAASAIVGGSTVSEIDIEGDALQNITNAWAAWEKRTKSHTSYGVRIWFSKRRMLQLCWMDKEGKHFSHSYGADEYLSSKHRGFRTLPPQQTPLDFEHA